MDLGDVSARVFLDKNDLQSADIPNKKMNYWENHGKIMGTKTIIIMAIVGQNMA